MQLDAAELLLSELDPSKAYPLEFVIFRITGYHPRNIAADLLTGLALQHDLGVMIEQLSETLDQRSADLSEPVLAIEDLTARLGVTSKTIQRWRRRGLPARRFVFSDGKRRVGFLLSSVERFVSANQEPLDNVKQVMVDEVDRAIIVRHARRLINDCRCSVDEVTHRIGSRLNRSPLTILHTLKKYDEEHPADGVLKDAAAGVTDDQRAKVLRGHRRGSSLSALASQFELSRSAVHRIILADRVARLSRRRVKFIDDPLYHQADAESVVNTIASQEDLGALPVSEVRIAADVPGPLAELCRTPLHAPGRERALFLKFNFHKMKFVQARRRLDPELARARDLAALEDHLRAAADTRNQIIRANLRLVVSIARRHLRKGVTIMELVSEGTTILMRAVESFDAHRGHKFSTYATLALMKGFARAVPQMLWNRSAGASDPEMLADVADRRASTAAERFLAREQVSELLGRLDARERDVLRAHFGLGAMSPATYRELADRFGLTKQRVRQIEQAAIAKLRSASA